MSLLLIGIILVTSTTAIQLYEPEFSIGELLEKSLDEGILSERNINGERDRGECLNKCIQKFPVKEEQTSGLELKTKYTLP